MLAAGCTQSGVARSNCAPAVLIAKWPGHRRTLSTCAGMLGVRPPDSLISLRKGQRITLEAGLCGPLNAEHVSNVRSSNPDVLAVKDPGSAIARFEATHTGTAAIEANTPGSCANGTGDLAYCVIAEV